MKACILSSLLFIVLVSASTRRFDPEAEDFGYVNPKPGVNEGARVDIERSFAPVIISLVLNHIGSKLAISKDEEGIWWQLDISGHATMR